MGTRRPFQKKLRSSGPVEQDGARKPGLTSSRGAATASTARAAYQAAIRSVGSAQSRRLGPGLPWGPGEDPTSQAALIPEEEYLAGDWLELDVPTTRSRPPRLTRPQGTGDSSRPSASGSDDEHPVRPRAQAEQSRLTCLESWRVLDKAGGGSLAVEPPRNTSVPRVLGSSGENPTAGQPSVGAQARNRAGFLVWRRWGWSPIFPDYSFLLPLPARFWFSPLLSGFEFEFRITSFSSLSHTGKVSACPFPAYPP